MKIAIDYDKTYTLDPCLWNDFIFLATRRDHEVYCVTARVDTPQNRREVAINGVTTIFTGFASKTWHMSHNLGIDIDVWIDDDPEMCALGRDNVKPIQRKNPVKRSSSRRR